MEEIGYDFRFKMLVLGSKSVGKSLLVRRLAGLDTIDFKSDATIGVEFSTHKMVYKDKLIKLHLWDTSGDKAFEKILTPYYKNMACIFIIFDLTNKDSLDQAGKAYENYMLKKEIDNNPPIIFLGNKMDLPGERQISSAKGQIFALERECHYMEVSAKTGANVSDMLKFIVEEMSKNIDPYVGGYGIQLGFKTDSAEVKKRGCYSGSYCIIS